MLCIHYRISFYLVIYIYINKWQISSICYLSRNNQQVVHDEEVKFNLFFQLKKKMIKLGQVIKNNH